MMYVCNKQKPTQSTVTLESLFQAGFSPEPSSQEKRCWWHVVILDGHMILHGYNM